MWKRDIKFNNNVFYAIDTRGVAIINKEDSSHFFISYPEAAVFSVLVENNDLKKSEEMLQAVLDRSRSETNRFVNRCIEKWEDQDIIRQDG